MRILLLFSLFFAIVSVPPVLVFLFDPYQYFHKSYFTPNKFIRRSGRMQFSGIIKNYIDKGEDFDAVILGGSLAQNFEPKWVSQLFDTEKNAISLAFSGATAAEQAFVAKHALATGKVKTALWSIGPGWRMGVDFVNNRRTMPYYMYNDNYLDDFNYLYGRKNIQVSLGYWFSLIFTRRVYYYYRRMGISSVPLVPWYEFGAWGPFDENDMEEMNQRLFAPAIQKKIKRRLEKTEKKLVNQKLPISSFNNLPANAFETEKKLLGDLAKSNPSVEFKLVFPPVSALYYHNAPQHNIDRTVNRAHALLEIAKDYNNVKAFFISEDYIINDLRYYKDAAHFDRSISRFILRQISRGNFELTSENVSTYIAKLKKSIGKYDRSNPFKFPSHRKVIGFDGRWLGK